MKRDAGAECGGWVPWCGWKPLGPGEKAVTPKDVARVFRKVFSQEAVGDILNEPAFLFERLGKVKP